MCSMSGETAAGLDIDPEVMRRRRSWALPHLVPRMVVGAERAALSRGSCRVGAAQTRSGLV